MPFYRNERANSTMTTEYGYAVPIGCDKTMSDVFLTTASVSLTMTIVSPPVSIVSLTMAIVSLRMLIVSLRMPIVSLQMPIVTLTMVIVTLIMTIVRLTKKGGQGHRRKDRKRVEGWGQTCVFARFKFC